MDIMDPEQRRVMRDAARMLRSAARQIDRLISDEMVGSPSETVRRFTSDIMANIHAATARIETISSDHEGGV